MEEQQKKFAAALRKVLAEDRSSLARHEDFLGAVERKVPMAAICDFRALENALKDSRLGEILLAADQKPPVEQQEALGKDGICVPGKGPMSFEETGGIAARG
jgi:hypothetical protein